MIVLLAILLVFMFGMNWFGKRSQQKLQAEHEKMMSEQLVPGAWVYTAVGFYGRFVDLDGDVLILETPGGEETYWNKAVLRSVGEPPFEVIEPGAGIDGAETAIDGVASNAADGTDYAVTADAGIAAETTGAAVSADDAPSDFAPTATDGVAGANADEEASKESDK